MSYRRRLPRDTKIDEAKPRIMRIFEQYPAQVFYSTQIETTLEKEFFHWITNKALVELADEKQIQRMEAIVHGNSVNFYAHIKHRYWKREQKRLQALLHRMFDPQFAQAVGRHGEMMFDSAFARNRFIIEAKNAKSWNGRTWSQTNHNLDRIVTRDSIAYGVEIKNMQSYIDHDELQTKLSMCQHLALTPLFVMRAAPKSYMFEIDQHKGFGLLFDDQLYPWGHGSLLAEVQGQLGLKVAAPADIPDGHMQRLLRWHRRKLPNPS
jgi:hypothetical protein